VSVYVVDTSVAAKWFFDEEHTDNALRLLDDRNELHVPDFLLIEVDSILCKRIRRGELDDGHGREIRSALRQFPIQGHAFAPLMDPAFELAVETHRSLYDCLFVALAVLLEGTMVTADRRLYDALSSGRLSEHLCWVGDLP